MRAAVSARGTLAWGPAGSPCAEQAPSISQGKPDRFADVTRHDEPGPTAVPGGATRRARDEPSEAQPRRLDQSPLGSRCGTEPARQRNLAGQDGRGPDRTLPDAGGERHRDCQVGGRLVDAKAAGDVDVDVVAGEVQPGM